MSFKELDPILKPTYNSLKDNIVKDFYVPVLSQAKIYYRISGYFDSSSLSIAAKGLSKFIKNNGKMKLLCSAKLYPQDLEIIEKASDVEKIVCQRFLDDLNNIEDELINDRLKVLGWMIANDILEIKVGINNFKGEIDRGILHSKTGILWDTDEKTDDLDHCIVFNGSNNETGAGWTSNIESFNVFRGNEDKKFMIEHINDFPKVWNNQSPYLDVMDIPEANKKALIDKAPSSEIELDRIIHNFYRNNKDYRVISTGNKKDNRKLFPHQKDAIDKWFENGKKGILEMATGTGKTFTAINCLRKLTINEDNIITVIACPYSHLVEQWYNDVNSSGLNVDKFKIYSSGNPNYKSDFNKLLKRIRRGRIRNAIIFTTHDTFSSEFFINKIKDIKSNLFLIADEMHHLGSSGYSLGLIDNYKYRLGLSATPEKYMDEDATQFLLDYFGGIVFTFTIKDALNNINPKTKLSYLTHYNYLPEKVNLNDNELKEYKELSKSIAIKFNSNDNEGLESLIRKRKRIIDNADEKYGKLREILRKMDNPDHLIVFCSPQQIDKVLDILKEEGVSPRHRFTSKEKNIKNKDFDGLTEREYLLKKFDKGEYKALVAIRCLNEGVDVPSADKVIIMSSSRNPIEYVQRRGRVLRRYKGKNLAYIYDMSVIPDVKDSMSDSIITKELERLYDFIDTADNRADCIRKLEKWGIL